MSLFTYSNLSLFLPPSYLTILNMSFCGLILQLVFWKQKMLEGHSRRERLPAISSRGQGAGREVWVPGLPQDPAPRLLLVLAASACHRPACIPHTCSAHTCPPVAGHPRKTSAHPSRAASELYPTGGQTPDAHPRPLWQLHASPCTLLIVASTRGYQRESPPPPCLRASHSL